MQGKFIVSTAGKNLIRVAFAPDFMREILLQKFLKLKCVSHYVDIGLLCEVAD